MRKYITTDEWHDACKAIDDDIKQCSHKVMANSRNTSVEEDKAMSSYIRGKYSDVPTSSEEFAMRKEMSSFNCEHCGTVKLNNLAESQVDIPHEFRVVLNELAANSVDVNNRGNNNG